MTDYGHELQFGSFVTPTAAAPEQAVRLAVLSEQVGLDVVSIQDHPYLAKFLDTWTLLSFIAARTSRVRLAPNVACLPLRPPVVLGRSVASLDLLTGGRVELGLGAGGFREAIEAVGGPSRTPGEGVAALAEAIEIIRAVWQPRGTIREVGDHYQVNGAHAGPEPAHDVPLWLGAYKPRMLALTGAEADGWVPSSGYAPPPTLGPLNEAIDDAALRAGREPSQVRRIYNVEGSFEASGGAGFLQGSAAVWAEQLADLTLTQGMSTYLLMSDDEDDLRRFAGEVAPDVRERVAAERR